MTHLRDIRPQKEPMDFLEMLSSKEFCQFYLSTATSPDIKGFLLNLIF